MTSNEENLIYLYLLGIIWPLLALGFFGGICLCIYLSLDAEEMKTVPCCAVSVESPCEFRLEFRDIDEFLWKTIPLT